MTDKFYSGGYTGVPSWHKKKEEGCTCGSFALKCDVHDPESPMNQRIVMCASCKKPLEGFCYPGECIICVECSERMPRFEVADSSKPKPSFQPTVNLTTFIDKDGVITQDLNVFDRVIRSVLDAREREVRMALIKQGWTPPPEKGTERFVVEWCEKKEKNGETIRCRVPVREMPDWVQESLSIWGALRGPIL